MAATWLGVFLGGGAGLSKINYSKFKLRTRVYDNQFGFSSNCISWPTLMHSQLFFKIRTKADVTRGWPSWVAGFMQVVMVDGGGYDDAWVIENSCNFYMGGGWRNAEVILVKFNFHPTEVIKKKNCF